MNQDTLFDKIIRKEIPARIAFEDDEFLAFHDISPQAPVHVLVIPKTKATSLNDLESLGEGGAGRYLLTISKVARDLNLDGSGYRVIFNTGDNGGQTVNYIHAHILGGRALRWPPG